MNIILFTLKNSLKPFLSNIMTKLLNEIYRIKNLMSINEQDETNENVSGTVIIGDHFAEIVSDQINTIPYLVDENMTVNLLMKRLSSSDIYENVYNLILSIGTVDYFKGIKYINSLCDLIQEVFPNANYYVFKGVISDFDIESEKDIKSIEEVGDIFYDEFNVCGFDIIGNHPIITDVNVDLTNPSVLDLLEISNEMSNGFSDKTQKIDDVTFNHKNIKLGGDETDFDTIYEFLERFEDMINSKNIYDKSVGDGFESDINQIKIALNFVTKGDGENLKLDGKIDNQMIDDIKSFQSRFGLDVTGVVDNNTLEELFYELKVESFNDRDLSMFLGKVKEIEYYLDGIVDISGAGLDSEQKSNVELLIKVMEDKGITNPYAQIGILSVIGKESNFVPQNENCYNNTDNSRIREVFGDCRLGGLSDIELTELKKNCKLFFDKVYGPDATECLGWDTGNDNPGDGYKYRGRGFNQITFKNNYKTYGNRSGIDLVSNPDQLNDIQVASEAAVSFLTNGKSIPEFKDKKTATEYFVNVNAGGVSGRSEDTTRAESWSERFDVEPR